MLAMLLLSAVLTGLQLAGAADRIEGRLSPWAVPDGDAITALDADAGKRQHKILLHQIDAPEQNQDYGMRSNQSLSDLVSGRTMSMEVLDIERYGRTGGNLLIGSTDANLDQVKRGMAWVYVKYARQQPFRAD